MKGRTPKEQTVPSFYAWLQNNEKLLHDPVDQGMGSFRFIALLDAEWPRSSSDLGDWYAYAVDLKLDPITTYQLLGGLIAAYILYLANTSQRDQLIALTDGEYRSIPFNASNPMRAAAIRLFEGKGVQCLSGDLKPIAFPDLVKPMTA